MNEKLRSYRAWVPRESLREEGPGTISRKGTLVCDHPVEVVPLAGSAPDAPRVGDVVVSRATGKRCIVRSPVVWDRGHQAWCFLAERRSGDLFCLLLMAIIWPPEEPKKTFDIKLKGSAEDAESLRAFAAEHGFDVEVTEK